VKSQCLAFADCLLPDHIYPKLQDKHSADSEWPYHRPDRHRDTTIRVLCQLNALDPHVHKALATAHTPVPALHRSRSLTLYLSKPPQFASASATWDKRVGDGNYFTQTNALAPFDPELVQAMTPGRSCLSMSPCGEHGVAGPAPGCPRSYKW